MKTMDGIFITVAVIWLVYEAVRMDRKTGHARQPESNAAIPLRRRDNVIPFRKKAS